MRTAIRTAALPLLLLALSACDSLVGGVDSGLHQRELAAARAIWAEKGPANYSYALDVACTCIPADQRALVQVTVTGATSSVVYADSADRADLGTPPAVYDQFAGVEALFTLVEEAIARPTAQFLAAYDAAYGFPRAYDAVFTDGTPRIVFVVSNFQPAS